MANSADAPCAVVQSNAASAADKSDRMTLFPHYPIDPGKRLHSPMGPGKANSLRGVRQNSLICINFAHCRAGRDILKPEGITGM
jgi:hypothetical protein